MAYLYDKYSSDLAKFAKESRKPNCGKSGLKMELQHEDCHSRAFVLYKEAYDRFEKVTHMKGMQLAI
jgi:hypothetical protein